MLTCSGFSRLLVRHPKVMDRLRIEIASVMGDDEHPSREQVKRMIYLDCIIKESMYHDSQPE